MKLIKKESSTDNGAIPRGSSFYERRYYETLDGTIKTKTKQIGFFQGRYRNWEKMFEQMPFDQNT